MSHPTRILIVERDTVAAEALRETLGRHGYNTQTTRSADEAIERLERDRSAGVTPAIGVVIADQDALGSGDRFGLIRRLHDGWPEVVPIVVSAFRKVEAAVAVMRLGAGDYLLKPVVEQELIDAVERAEQRHALLAYQHSEDDKTDNATDEAPAAPPAIIADGPAPAWSPMPLAEAMKEPERQILLAALEANGWNRQATAKQLEINRTTLYKKIRQYRLDEPAA